MTLDLHGGRLGILAGGGDLPKDIIKHCQKHNIDFYAIYFKGQSDQDVIEGIDHSVVRLGQSQKSLNLLKKSNCTHVVFAGNIKRPGVFDIRPDLRTAKFFTKLGLGAAGDDRLLRAVRAELEGEGFLILGAHDILPDILTPEGLLTDTAPDQQDWADIKYGYDVLDKTGMMDIGQACIVQQGVVLGVEAVEGTDRLIIRCSDYKRSGGGGVLIKRSKPGQDMSLDLPTTGEMTIRHLQESGFKGLALEADKSQILNMTETISAANAAGIFIVGFTEDDI